MKSSRYFCASLWVVLLVLLVLGQTGCVSRIEFDKCARRNEIQLERIRELETGRQTERIRWDTLQQKYDTIVKEKGYWQQQINALNATLQAKSALIQQLTDQMGQAVLPVELRDALSEWARASGTELVSYEEKTGIVRFTSDLLFNKGEDTVQAQAGKQLEQFSAIMNTPSAQGFDVLIVGHTDDLPILRAETKAKHPTNWHLSAHRAISVEKALAEAGLMETRMAVMGLGEFRPIEPNKPNQQGNPKNRRVEIYIVPAGRLQIQS